MTRTQPGVYWIATLTITGVLAACRGSDPESTDVMGGSSSRPGEVGSTSSATRQETSPPAQGGSSGNSKHASGASSLGGQIGTAHAETIGGRATLETSSVGAIGGTSMGGVANTSRSQPNEQKGGDGGASGRNSAGGTRNSSSVTKLSLGGTKNTGGTSSMKTTAASGGALNNTTRAANTGGSSSTSTGAGGASTASSSNATNPGSCAIPTPASVPIGYGAAATGGGDKTPIEVNSMEALVAELAKYKKGTAGLVLRFTGTFDFKTISDPCTQHTKDARTVDIKEMSNVTLIGAKGSAANFGLHLSKVQNVVIRNMTFGLLPGGGDSDAIGIEGESSNIWIDHNELFSSMVECDGAGDTEFDGLLDTKAGSHHITISYNYFHDHHKVALNGSSDSDTGERLITFHHNRFENVGSRTPLQRDGITHIFNNYFNRIVTSGINVRLGGISLIESNYFENSQNPVTSRDSSTIGYWDLRNNFVGSGITWTTPEDADTPFANATDWKTSKAFTATLGYSYSVDTAACVKAIVTASAGAKL
ncbi:MAG TPA: hypothetical protein VKP30_31220 [Polyangiaceae bacterium]|nr:hypothetical protein [Polyangiaceae bacterium]